MIKYRNIEWVLYRGIYRLNWDSEQSVREEGELGLPKKVRNGRHVEVKTKDL